MSMSKPQCTMQSQSESKCWYYEIADILLVTCITHLHALHKTIL